MTSEPPQLPGFRQLAPLRRGPHAHVFRALQHPDRWVEVTVFDVRLTDRAAAEQFRTEARAIARLAHPGIVAMHSADVLPDARPYLVTELCEKSLAERIAERGKLDPHEVTAVGLVVGRALLHAHDAGVRHGDLTPSCVLLCDGGVPVLAGVEPAVLRDYREVGEPTPTHAAPETVRADGAVDERTDVYGLGTVLYPALAGRPPVSARHGEQERDRLARILLDEPSTPPGPQWLADLVLAMLAKDPAARPTLRHVVELLAADGLVASKEGGRRESSGPKETSGPVAPAPRLSGTSAPGGPVALSGTSASDGPVALSGTSASDGPVALLGTSASDEPVMLSGTSGSDQPVTLPDAARGPSPWALTAACLAVVVAVVVGVLLGWPVAG